MGTVMLSLVGSFSPALEVAEVDGSESSSFFPLAVDNTVSKVGSGAGNSAMEAGLPSLDKC